MNSKTPHLLTEATVFQNVIHALSEDLNVSVASAPSFDAPHDASKRAAALQAADLTAAWLSPHPTTAQVVVKEPAILCGCAWFEQAFKLLDPDCQISWTVTEGAKIQPNQTVCHIQGRANAILTAERTALNFLQTLSGTASATAKAVAALHQTGHTHTQLLDTRKTLPGLRLAQKYAVRIGGGCNHRVGLFDQILIKENHIMAAGSIAQAVTQARAHFPEVKVEVETEQLDELQQACASGADRVMLDNFGLDQIEQAVAWVKAQAFSKPPQLEASGNVTLETLPQLGQTGVDFVSMGATTKHLSAVDYSLRLIS